VPHLELDLRTCVSDICRLRVGGVRWAGDPGAAVRRVVPRPAGRRRAGLLEAGLELLGGDADPAELTVRGICDRQASPPATSTRASPTRTSSSPRCSTGWSRAGRYHAGGVAAAPPANRTARYRQYGAHRSNRNPGSGGDPGPFFFCFGFPRGPGPAPPPQKNGGFWGF